MVWMQLVCRKQEISCHSFGRAGLSMQLTKISQVLLLPWPIGRAETECRIVQMNTRFCRQGKKQAQELSCWFQQAWNISEKAWFDIEYTGITLYEGDVMDLAMSVHRVQHATPSAAKVMQLIFLTQLKPPYITNDMLLWWSVTFARQCIDKM